MALEHLLAELERQAGEEAKKELEHARSQAADIREALEARLVTEREAVLERRKRELRSQADAEIGRRRTELRAQVLAARQEFLSKVFETAHGRLRDVASQKRSRSNQLCLLRVALTYMPDAGAVVRSPTHLADAVGDVVEEYDGVTMELDEKLETGVVVEAPDGSVRADATLAQRLHTLMPDLAIEILRQLDGDCDGGVG